jgi:replicative DNA helicase
MSNTLIYEERLLSALLLNNSNLTAVIKAFSQLNINHFSNEHYRKLFYYLKCRFAANESIYFDDIVRESPENVDIHQILELANIGATKTMIEKDIKSIIDGSFVTKKIKQLRELVQEIEKNKNIVEARQHIEQSVSQFFDFDGSTTMMGIKAREFYDSLGQQMYEQNHVLTTGLPSFDNNFNGFPSCGVVTIAGRSGNGKTSLSMLLFQSVIKSNPDKKGLFYSLEMNENAFRRAWIRQAYGVDMYNMDDKYKSQIIADIPKMPVNMNLFFSEHIHNLDQLIASITLYANSNKLSIVVIDYIGLIPVERRYNNTFEKIGIIGDALQRLASRLQICIVILTQVNRETVNNKSNQMPRVEHASEGSKTEHISELWLGIDKPDRYRDEIVYKDWLIVRSDKTRNGRLDTIGFKFKDGVLKDISANPPNYDEIKKNKKFSFAGNQANEYATKD